MKNLQEQKEFYNEQWEKNSPTLGVDDGWIPDPEPLYTIGVWLHQDLYKYMQSIIDKWQKILPEGNNLWPKVDQLHISLEMPGRLGKHFNDNDIPKMVAWLQEVAREVEQFEVTLGNISCFPAVPFREVYDKKGSLFKLHNAIADKIPWSLHPQFRYENYNPHMSICYPGGDVTALINHEDFSRELEWVKMSVESVYLTRWYDGNGVLESSDVVNIELGSGKLLA